MIGKMWKWFLKRHLTHLRVGENPWKSLILRGTFAKWFILFVEKKQDTNFKKMHLSFCKFLSNFLPFWGWFGVIHHLVMCFKTMSPIILQRFEPFDTSPNWTFEAIHLIPFVVKLFEMSIHVFYSVHIITSRTTRVMKFVHMIK